MLCHTLRYGAAFICVPAVLLGGIGVSGGQGKLSHRRSTARQDAAARQELTGIMLKMAKASIRGDAAFFDKVLAEEVVYTTLNGEVKNKVQVLDDYRKHRITFQSHAFDDIRIRLYGGRYGCGHQSCRRFHLSGKTPSQRDSQYPHVCPTQRQVVAFQSTRIAAEQASGVPSVR